MAATHLIVERLSLTDLTRIFSKIRIDPSVSWNNTPCWTWIGGLMDGYGSVWWKGKTIALHRLFYAWLVAPVPFGRSPNIDHLCRNRAYGNPLHLELVPARINTLRGEGSSAKKAAQTHCEKGLHLLPSPDKRGERTCMICKGDWKRIWRKGRRGQPNSEAAQRRMRYQSDAGFRAREIARGKRYKESIPIEIRRAKQKAYDLKRRPPKKSAQHE